MPGSLEPTIRDFARADNFATIAVHLDDGSIASHVMWVDASDQHVLINTEVHRAKYRALQSNPLTTVTIWDRDDAYKYAEVRGRLVGEVRGPEARAHIDALSQKYVGSDYDAAQIKSERVILQIEPRRQRSRGL